MPADSANDFPFQVPLHRPPRPRRTVSLAVTRVPRSSSFDQQVRSLSSLSSAPFGVPTETRTWSSRRAVSIAHDLVPPVESAEGSPSPPVSRGKTTEEESARRLISAQEPSPFAKKCNAESIVTAGGAGKISSPPPPSSASSSSCSAPEASCSAQHPANVGAAAESLPSSPRAARRFASDSHARHSAFLSGFQSVVASSPPDHSPASADSAAPLADDGHPLPSSSVGIPLLQRQLERRQARALARRERHAVDRNFGRTVEKAIAMADDQRIPYKRMSSDRKSGSRKSASSGSGWGTAPENSYWAGVWDNPAAVSSNRSGGQRRSSSASDTPAEEDVNPYAIQLHSSAMGAGSAAQQADAMQNPFGSQPGTIAGIFSTRKPKDIGAGLSSGCKNFAKGVGLGLAGLVALPIVKARESGPLGFVSGLGQGIVAAVVLPIGGVGVGVYQAGRGIANTPEAIGQSASGMKWNKKTREWVKNWYSLDEEAEFVKSVNVSLEAEKEEGKRFGRAGGSADDSAPPSNTEGVGGRAVKDTKYYETLGVATNASQTDIRKAYYKLARDNHPDKHPDDPQAKERFQAMGEAYQVLGDEGRRKEYDTHGKDATQDMPIIDSSLFFMMLFGSTLLEPYIGKLKMAMFVESMDEAGEADAELASKIMEHQQLIREVELAVQLRERIEPFVNGDEEVRDLWRAKMRSEAAALCEASFGDSIVEAVGWVYSNRAAQFIGKHESFLGLQGRMAKFQANHRSINTKMNLGTSVLKASIAARKLHAAEEESESETTSGAAAAAPSSGSAANAGASSSSATSSSATAAEGGAAASGKSGSGEGEGTEENDAEAPEDEKTRKARERKHAEQVKQFEETMPLILETMLKVCLLDIEQTLRQACKKVMKDMVVPMEIRKLRARALIELGKILQEEAQTKLKMNKGAKIDARKHLEEAFVMAAQKAEEDRIEKEEAAHAAETSGKGATTTFSS